MRITILVNTLQAVNSFIYGNHIKFFVETTKKDPTIEYFFFTPHRMAIDTARNHAAKTALETESDYLLFIDDDVLIPSNTLELLMKADKDIIAGLVIIRGYPFDNMAFRYDGPQHLTYYNDLPLANNCAEGHSNFDIKCDSCIVTPLQELTKVAAVGFSCCLIKTDVLKAMEPPYFVTGTNHTEDIYFCLKTQELEPEPEIFLHTGVQCGHLLNPEPIEWRNRRKMQNNYGEAVKTVYRDKDHISHCLAAMK